MTANLSRIAKGLATALGRDDALRERLRLELAQSPLREQKLEFRRLVRDENLALGEAVAAARLTTHEALLAAVDSLVPLELYFPVDAHRQWDGGPKMVVATALNDEGDGDALAYDLLGNEYPISHNALPRIPTLALVPAELDFAQAEAELAFARAKTASPDLSGAGLLSGGTLTMTESYLFDDHEPGLFGDPEIYVHLATVDTSNNTTTWTRCSGDAMRAGYDAYEFDQNGTTWAGSVLLAGEDDIMDEDFIITVWEDDNSRCDGVGWLEPKADTIDWESVFTDADVLTAVTASALCIAGGAPVFCLGLLDLLVWTLQLAEASVNDDFIGVASHDPCFPALSGPVSLALYDQYGDYAWSYIKVDDDFLYRALCPLQVTIGGDQYACTGGRFPEGDLDAIKSTTEGQYSYKWYEESVLRGTSSEYTLYDTSEGNRHIYLEVTRAYDGSTDTHSKWIPVYDEPPEGLECLE